MEWERWRRDETKAWTRARNADKLRGVLARNDLDADLDALGHVLCARPLSDDEVRRVALHDFAKQVAAYDHSWYGAPAWAMAARVPSQTRRTIPSMREFVEGTPGSSVGCCALSSPMTNS